MDELISRQKAIDTLADMHCKSDEDGYVWIIRSDAWKRIDALPPAQPEIIRCQECKYSHELTRYGKHWYCGIWQYAVFPEGFCHRAER